jgi:hypothetical protein
MIFLAANPQPTTVHSHRQTKASRETEHVADNGPETLEPA